MTQQPGIDSSSSSNIGGNTSSVNAVTSSSGGGSGGGGGKRKEIYTYYSPWQVYTLGWSNRRDDKFKLAVGSFIEEYANKIEIIQLDGRDGDFVRKGIFDHSYPATKIMWTPEKGNTASMQNDLLATTGDYLRLWDVREDNSVSLSCLLNNNKNSEFCAPLTSFDWNDVDPSIVGTSSIDTTCTIWNIETQQVKTQLIAHDKEVYDIAFAHSKDVFASVGADGSVRMFDLRSLEHSTIMYESPDLVPLLRLEWNKQNFNYLATFSIDSKNVTIIDTRFPSIPFAELSAHRAPVNGVTWAPHSACHICTAGEDSKALIWEVNQGSRTIEDPILAYNAQGEVNQVQWSTTQPDWIGITFSNRVQILRV